MALFSEQTPLPQRTVALRVEDPSLHALLTALLRHWRIDPRSGGESRLILQVGPKRESLILAVDDHEVERMALPTTLEKLWLALQQRLFEPPRLHYRIPLRLSAQLYQHGKPEPFMSTSLSDAGVRFELFRELVRDEEVEVELPLGDGALRFDSKVIYCVPARNSGRMIVGVMFQGVSREAGERLRAFLVESTLRVMREQLERERFQAALDVFQLPAAVRSRLLG